MIGAGRGGTSLLTACLDGHSRLHVESEAFAADTLLGLKLPVTDPRRLLGQRLDRFHACCEEARARHPGLVWGNKITTEHVFGLEDHNALNPPYVDVTRRLVERMAGYRIVFVLRDGRACIDSKVRRTGQPVALAAFRWRYSVQVLRSLRQTPSLRAVVRFEDLVLEPRVVLEGVCDALGIAFEEGMLEQTESDLLVKEYRQPGFVAEKAAPAELPPEILAFIRGDLAECGYDVET